jgi:hypothetical protein
MAEPHAYERYWGTSCKLVTLTYHPSKTPTSRPFETAYHLTSLLMLFSILCSVAAPQVQDGQWIWAAKCLSVHHYKVEARTHYVCRVTRHSSGTYRPPREANRIRYQPGGPEQHTLSLIYMSHQAERCKFMVYSLAMRMFNDSNSFAIAEDEAAVGSAAPSFAFFDAVMVV